MEKEFIRRINVQSASVRDVTIDGIRGIKDCNSVVIHCLVDGFSAYIIVPFGYQDIQNTVGVRDRMVEDFPNLNG